MRQGVLAEPTDLVRHPPSGAQLRHVVWVLAGLALIFALLVPVARLPLAQAPEFIPMYGSVLIGANLLTGILLIGHVHTGRSRALGILVLGYLLTALIASAHLLTFPGLFAAQGVLGGNVQTTPWLHLAWHALFPLFVLGYAHTPAGAAPLPPHFMRVGALLIVLIVALLVLVSTSGARWLPPLMEG